jgi:AraC-like DNA-binding protein
MMKSPPAEEVTAEQEAVIAKQVTPYLGMEGTLQTITSVAGQLKLSPATVMAVARRQLGKAKK